MPRAFISYSHDSPEHEKRVLAFAERLRKDGVDAQLDQYVPGTPPKSWPRWMLDQLDWAEFVLVVCTETYYRRFRGHEEPSKGKGADWEGNLITLEMYDAKSTTTKFAPVLFDGQNEQFIPEPLRGHTRHLLNSETNYTKLYAFLTGQAGVTPGELGLLKMRAREAVEPLRFDVSDMSVRSPSVTGRDLVARQRPEKISLARLPVTGSELFGREEDLAFLEAAWTNQQVNLVIIVAWGGVGKSALVNHWLRGMATRRYDSAELVFGWSFYRQGTSGDTSSADEFLDAVLAWFGDPDPRHGTAWEKGERLARLIACRRTLLVLDGLEPLQNPPGPEEGRLREPSLQALLRELAAFNTGLCVITTRLPVADVADREGTSVMGRELEQLSSEAGAQLLRGLGVKGPETELQSASDEFGGHCLALTLLGSYLTDAYDGDIRCRDEVSNRLAHDVRQGAHARKVMASYQSWFGEGPELAVLRLLGLFDRPAEEKAIEALLKPPTIQSH